MSISIKAILWSAAAAGLIFLFPWKTLGVSVSLLLLAPLAGLWLLMEAMRLELAIRLTVGIGLSCAWIILMARLYPDW